MVFRNDPCPCGSGKRHKKCCLRAAKKRAADKRTAAAADERTAALRDALERGDMETLRKLGVQEIVWHDDGLDALSNSVLQLIADKKFDEALAACARLRAEFPDVIDGLDRAALVHEVMGDRDLAVEFYGRALAFTERLDQHEGFNDEFRVDLRNKIASLSLPTTGSVQHT